MALRGVCPTTVLGVPLKPGEEVCIRVRATKCRQPYMTYFLLVEPSEACRLQNVNRLV